MRGLWNHACASILMQIPDTPEQFFEYLADDTIRHLFQSFDHLPVHQQKLIRIIHTELTKGQLSDYNFRGMLLFILEIWRSLNTQLLSKTEHCIDESPEIDSDWIDAAIHFSRMDQYLSSVTNALSLLPSPDPTAEANPRNTGQYWLFGPGD